MSTRFDIDPNLHNAISEELYPDEKLLWVGKPTPIRVVMQQQNHNLVVIAFLMGILAAMFGRFGVDPLLIPNVEAPILSLSLILEVGVFSYVIYLYWRATQIVYAITNRRALIMKPTIDGLSVLAYNVIPYIERRSFANDKGDLIFATETYNRIVVSNFRYGVRHALGTRKVGFFGIDNVREVEQLMFKTFVRRAHPNFDDLLEQ
jgi:hypothetical protein